MSGFIAALALFGAVAAIVAALQGREGGIDEAAPELRRVPQPRARDLHTVTVSLAPVRVPRWT